LAYYPFHGMFISLSLAKTIELGIHIPFGNVATLQSNEVTIVGRTLQGTTTTESVWLRALPHGALGTGETRDFLWVPDPFQGEQYFGPLQGYSDGSHYAWYLFAGFSDDHTKYLSQMPKGILEGTVELPTISINGVQYPAQVIPFHSEKAVGIHPINC